MSKLLAEMTPMEDAEDTGKSSEEPSSLSLQGAYATIVQFMSKQNGSAIEQVQRFIDELQRISLLWDEMWLGTLQQYNVDINKRVKFDL